MSNDPPTSERDPITKRIQTNPSERATPQPQRAHPGAQDASPACHAGARARDNEVAESLRGRLQELAPSRIDKVVDALDMALQARKTAWGHCSTCKTSVKVDINDSTAAVNAFKALLEATEGKPATAGDVSQTALVVRRVGQSRS